MKKLAIVAVFLAVGVAWALIEGVGSPTEEGDLAPQSPDGSRSVGLASGAENTPEDPKAGSQRVAVLDETTSEMNGVGPGKKINSSADGGRRAAGRVAIEQLEKALSAAVAGQFSVGGSMTDQTVLRKRLMTVAIVAKFELALSRLREGRFVAIKMQPGSNQASQTVRAWQSEEGMLVLPVAVSRDSTWVLGVNLKGGGYETVKAFDAAHIQDMLVQARLEADRYNGETIANRRRIAQGHTSAVAELRLLAASADVDRERVEVLRRRLIHWCLRIKEDDWTFFVSPKTEKALMGRH